MCKFRINGQLYSVQVEDLRKELTRALENLGGRTRAQATVNNQ